MNKKMKLNLIILLLSLFSLEAISEEKTYLGYRHIHTSSAHTALEFLQGKIKPLIQKGRINLYEVTEKNFKYDELPKFVKEQFFLTHPKNLINNPTETLFSKTFKKSRFSKKMKRKLKRISKTYFETYVKSLIALGSRSQNAVAKNYLSSTLTQMNLTPISSGYNIISKIDGVSDKNIVIIAHMDTVRGTVGADDNASGSAGVLELARNLSQIFKNSKPAHNIYFVLSEDEEIGLLGAKKFVKDFEKQGKLQNTILAINMDMIAYNTNGVIDIETNSQNEELANIFAESVLENTQQTPNLVLEPWGSDHMPFLEKGVPTVLTIESWQTHTPCWHKACDTFETLNTDYAIDILKVNLGVILSFLE